MEQKPSIGRIVHFHDDDGTHVAAIVAVASDPWIVDLRTISFDPANDRGHSAIRYDMDGSNGTWRWPSRVP